VVRRGNLFYIPPVRFFQKKVARHHLGLWLLAALCCGSGTAATAQTAIGSIPGSFDVTLYGSATYSIPIRVTPGTAGMDPKLSIIYDSQAPSGPLGAGWSIAGISAITRGPKNARFDGVPDGVKMTENDALYLDGQRLVAIRSDGSGTNRTIEYRKEMDDQTRILEIGADFGSAKFVVNTKGGLRIDFDSVPGAQLDQNRGDVRFSDGSVLLRAETRVADTSGNFIDFYYLTNGNGNYDIKSIRYTGHEARGSVAGRAPYASVEFNYESAPRAQQTFVAGRALIIDTRLKEIVTRVASKPSNLTSSGWLQVARYSFEYEDRETANRFVLKRVHQFGEDATELTPTNFVYSAPKTGWASAKRYALPAILAKHQELAAGYRFAHVSSSRKKLPDLLYAAQIDGQIEAFAFRNKGNAWAPLEGFKPPIAFAGADGADFGVIVADVNGDGRADLLQSYQIHDQAAVRNSFIAGSSRWDRQAGYELPFLVSKDGKVVARYQMAYWTGGPGPDLIYQSESQHGFLINTGTGWRPDDRYAPPSDLNVTWTVDVDCSGKPSLVAAVKNSVGQLMWKVFRFGDQGWDEVKSDAFKFPFSPDIDSGAVRIISIDGSACPGILVATAQGGGLHAVFQASRTGWKPLADKAPPFDLVDASGNLTDAVVANVAGEKSSDIFANRVFPDGHAIKFMYFQTATGWKRAPDEYYIPILRSSSTDSPSYVSIADFTGDGRAGIAFPSNSRQHFGRIFVASDDGFKERLDYVPPVAFARQDHQDQGVRLLDLNGDGLPDLLVSRPGGTNPAGAWLNTGSGWKPLPGLMPPVPFAGNDIAGNPVQFVDVDGDGYLDLLYAYRDKNGTTTHFYRNVASADGSRKWSDVATDGSNLSGLAPLTDYPFAAEKIGDLGVRFADVAGTGRPYMLVGFQPASGPAKLAAFRNDGTKWVAVPEYAPPVPFVAQVGAATDPSRDLSVQITDVNGDGLPDIVAKYHDPANPANIVEGVWLNTGSGWEKDPSISVPVTLDLLTFDQQTGYQWEKNTSIQWADVNGDGLPDIIYCRREGGTNKSVTYVGTGRGWIPAAMWQVPLDALPDRGGDTGLRVIDVNGDGYPDLLYVRQDSDGTIKKGLYVNTAAGWLQKDTDTVPDIPFVDKDGNDLGVRFYDVDGRGLVDIIQSYSGDSQESEVEINQARRSEVIRTIDAGYGLVTNLVYQSLIESSITDAGPVKLPLEGKWARVYEPVRDPISYPILAPVPATYAVRRVIVNKGQGKHVAFSYRYGGYRMDALAKKALGFAWRESFNETNNVLTQVYLSQDVQYPGKPLREKTCWLNTGAKHSNSAIASGVCDQSGRNGFDWVRLLTKSDTVWKVEGAEAGGGLLPKRMVRQISLSTATSYSYELDGRATEWHTDAFTYDEPIAPKTVLDRRLNVLISTTTWGDGSSLKTVNSYDADDSDRWFLGRLTKSVVTKTPVPVAAGQTEKKPEVRAVGFSYDEETGLLTAETVNLGTTREVTTSYQMDEYGNVHQRQIHAAGIQDHDPTIYSYDDQGRFLRSETNPLKQVTSTTEYTTTGLPRTTTNTNGVTTSYEYDTFGRLRQLHLPTGTDSALTEKTTYILLSALDKWIPISGVSAVYAIKVQNSDGNHELPAVTRLFNSEGKIVRTVTEGFTKDDKAHRLILRDVDYDALGRRVRVSLPYEKGQNPPWLLVTWDTLGRVTKQVAADGGTVRREYAGRVGGGTVATVIDLRTKSPSANRTTTATNMHSLPVELIDPGGGRVHYEYDAGGRVVRVKDPLGSITKYSYDDFGNRKSVLDPDIGYWTYQYDSLGRLVEQTDSDAGGSQFTRFEYDALSRVKTETRPSQVWKWEYDTAEHGVGKVSVVSGDSGQYQQRYLYDSLGRVHGVAVTISGNTYTTEQIYDTFGRIAGVQYPDQFGVDNIYDQKGFLVKVVGTGNGTPYWALGATDTFGHTTADTLGNGARETSNFDSMGRPAELQVLGRIDDQVMDLNLKYDLGGNLLHREESTQHKSEDFSYDELDRLTAISRPDGSGERYSYDAGGRITFKSGIGNYVYADGPSAQSLGCNASPIAVHAVVMTMGTRPEGQHSYGYDCHGNMVARDKDIYTYSSDGRLVRVERNPTENKQQWVQFDYGPDGVRYRERAKHGLRLLETISVAGYEKITEFGNRNNALSARFVRRRWYINNPDGTFAVVEKSREEFDNYGMIYHAGATQIGINPVDAEKTWYLHRDQLGSVLAITHETGSVRARYWYDPWGICTSSILDPLGITSGNRLEDSWTREFIGQEQLQDFNLIHLNGRVYDPDVGRFTSPDPLNQSALDSQLYDAYSYGRNNPLRYVDPSGFDLWGTITQPFRAAGEAIGNAATAAWHGVTHFVGEAGKWLSQNWREVLIVAAAVVVTVLTAGAAAPALGTAILSGMAGGATAGALGAALYGGNFSDVLAGAIKGGVIGAFSGAAFYGVGTLTQGGGLLNDVGAVAGHGAVGGAREAVMGGNFWQGFESGALTKTSTFLVPSFDSTALNTARAAVVGGATAAIGGGDFANGAVTGAFSYALNDAMHPPRDVVAYDQPVRSEDPITAAILIFSGVGELAELGAALFDEAMTEGGMVGIEEGVTVTHFTDAAGVQAITESGTLQSGTYVTLPGEVSGLDASQVESALEIQPGRGTFSTTIQVPRSQLAVPENGAFTSGGKIQFQLTEPAARGPFTPTPGIR
jgi:RHS repeat-associated protein